MTPLASEHAALVAAVAEKRDREAFTRLFDYFGPRLNAYLIRLGCDRASAEEITQDVMVSLWRKAHLFEPAKSSLATWLYRIARNRRIDILRRDRVDFVDPDDFALDVADESTVDAERLVDAQSRDDVLRGAMAGLPDEQLALVKLAFFESLSHSEIAEKTGLPLGTVKSRIRLAFTRLRRALEAGGVVEAE
ncbi:MAG: sigma-70 family RNA polymerase sigma factor [Beijerinckiaceae bacterium]|jgi:RNA polymerase sigma factor (sigma-70 family)|nr:sigma-70 family RNA polymerase sigma factor [Beijerinckiaceae bacterium]MDO9442753.1 sigma-70 family RNA polymerase sigma factor [Beijerinckiaceae bacterium]